MSFMYKRLFPAICLCLGFLFPAAAQERAEEANLKAAFIYNFTKYIDWDQADDSAGDFTIGILGPSSLTAPLQEIAGAKTVNNRKIVIRQFANPSEITYCNVLVIPAEIPFALSSVLEKTQRKMLTIAEQPGWGERGVDINLVIVNAKLKFEANLKSIAASGLHVSSQLLKLAKIVGNS